VADQFSASASDERPENTFQDAEAALREALQIQEHLIKQERELERLINTLGSPPGQ
jgi:hypothetical protein